MIENIQVKKQEINQPSSREDVLKSAINNENITTGEEKQLRLTMMMKLRISLTLRLMMNWRKSTMKNKI